MAMVPVGRHIALGYTPNGWAMENVHQHSARFIAGTTARQVGKTVAASMEIDEGMSAPVDDYGKPPFVGVVAPTYDKAELSIGMYIENLSKVFGKDSFKLNQNKHELTIMDPLAGTVGAKLRWLSSDDPYSVVGFTFSKLIVDEAQAVPDIVWHKIRPTLDVREARVIAFGTPDITPEQSWFRGMWLKGQDEDATNYHSFTVSAVDNEWMSWDTVVEAKDTLPFNEFRRLYLGEWVDEEGVVFRNFESALVDTPPAFDSKKRYVMGVDLAVHEDFNVVIVAEQATRIAVHMERWNQTDPLITYDRIQSIWERFNKPHVVADETGMGIPMVRELRERGLRVTGVSIHASNKMEMITRLAGDLEHRRIMLPKWDDLIREFRGFVLKRTPTGKVTASAAAGYHDDIIMALVMLNEGLHKRPRNGGKSGTRNYLSGVGGRAISVGKGLVVNA